MACFTFDNLGEAAEIGAGTCTGVDPDGHPSLTEGLPRLLEMLARHEVRSTFFVEGWNAVHHPSAVRSISDAGHEVGMHGWVHETWDTLDPADEMGIVLRATEALVTATGSVPVGFRAPGGSRTDRTEAFLLEHGYQFDASLGDAMRPSRLPGGLPNVPFVWPGVDGYWYLRPDPPDPTVVRDAWLAALETAAETDRLFLLICHPFITGVDAERRDALEAVIERALADRRIEVRTAGEVAASID